MELYGEYIVRFNGSNFGIGEPLVRCRDCIRYSLDDYGNTWCAYVASAVQPDGFCAWGERKEVDE